MRCTLGEISDALEAAWGRHEATASVSGGVYAAERGGQEDPEVAAVAERVRDFEGAAGRRPRILVAKMGQDGHDRGARVRGRVGGGCGGMRDGELM